MVSKGWRSRREDWIQAAVRYEIYETPGLRDLMADAIAAKTTVDKSPLDGNAKSALTTALKNVGVEISTTSKSGQLANLRKNLTNFYGQSQDYEGYQYPYM